MIDWDAVLLAPVMREFGDGTASDPSTLPVYMPAGGMPFALADAVFDRAYSEVTIEGEASTTRRPCLGVRLALFAVDPAQNDKVSIPSAPGTFIVKDVQPDGHGHAKLMLMGPIA